LIDMLAETVARYFILQNMSNHKFM
jgi:hypothetical protein